MPKNRLAYTPSEVAGIAPATFSGYVYNPTTEFKHQDYDLLSRTIEAYQARIDKATEKQSEVDQALATIESKLHNSEKTSGWFKDYKDNIKKQIQEQIAAGNYRSAIRTATTLATQTIADPAIQGRIQANAEYEEELKVQKQRRDKGDISQATYDWWLSNNPYTYQDKKDDAGNVIGIEKSGVSFRPVNDINWANQANIAFKLLSPKKHTSYNSSTTQEFSNEDLDENGKPKALSQTDTTTINSYEKISKEDIVKNIDELLAATPDGYRQAEQAYNVAIHDYKNLEKQLEGLDPTSSEYQTIKEQLAQRNLLLQNNGSPISYKEYYARMVTNNLFAQELAYNWITTKTGNSTVAKKNPSYSGKGGDKTNNTSEEIPTQFATSTTTGPLVEDNSNTDENLTNTTQAATNIGSRFENNNKPNNK